MDLSSTTKSSTGGRKKLLKVLFTPVFFCCKVFFLIPEALLMLVSFSVETADSKTTEMSLKNLKPGSLYKAFMMVRTFGGSLNGSTIHFKTETFGWYCIFIICDNVLSLAHFFHNMYIYFLSDMVDIVGMITGSGVGVSLIIIMAFLTLSFKGKR